MKRYWKVIFNNGKSCTMILPEDADSSAALDEAVKTFLTDELRVE